MLYTCTNVLGKFDITSQLRFFPHVTAVARQSDVSAFLESYKHAWDISILKKYSWQECRTLNIPKYIGQRKKCGLSRRIVTVLVEQKILVN